MGWEEVRDRVIRRLGGGGDEVQSISSWLSKNCDENTRLGG